MVRRLTIRSANRHIEQSAVTDLLEILGMVPNLRRLELNVFKEANLDKLDGVLAALGEGGLPFRLRCLTTDAPFGGAAEGQDVINLCMTQPDIIYLAWNDMHIAGAVPAMRVPADSLPKLKYLSCQIGLRPFEPAARSVTHLEVGLLPQNEIDEILQLFADQLVSLKIAERRDGQYTEVSPAVMFRRGIPKTLRYLEIRELKGFYFVSASRHSLVETNAVRSWS